jgi:uncharacterized protein (TIGR00290 family)
MNLKKKVTVSWSGGKDSAFSLYKILMSGEHTVKNLHTIINKDTKRVGLHGVPERLIEAQAEAIGLPLVKLYLESSTGNEPYERMMGSFYKQCIKEGLDAVGFGDIFLEDLRNYRENLLTGTGLLSLYPIWGIDTNILWSDFIHVGFKAVLCSADVRHFRIEQLGETVTSDFLKAISPDIDPCGEHGEFHSFVYDGPIFQHPVQFKKGEVVSKTYTYRKVNEDGSMQKLQSKFWFQDLKPIIL